MQNVQLFVPYMISIADLLYAMRKELPYGEDIQVDIVMFELLTRIFFERENRYGRFSGVMGSYLVQIPVVMTEAQQRDVDVLMHDFEAQLADVLAQTFPSMVMQPTNHYFYFPPNETDLVVYVPVTEDLSPEISAKAVPEYAIRNSVR